MSDTFLAVDRETIEKLTKLAKGMGVSEEYLPKWISYTLHNTSDDFAEYVRMFWLSGQALNIVTGETINSTGAFVPAGKRRRLKTDDVYYSVHPGVGIHGSLNFHGRWSKPAYRQFGHEFMKPAFQAFTAGSKVERDVLENIDNGFTWALNGGGR